MSNKMYIQKKKHYKLPKSKRPALMGDARIIKDISELLNLFDIDHRSEFGPVTGILLAPKNKKGVVPFVEGIKFIRKKYPGLFEPGSLNLN